MESSTRQTVARDCGALPHVPAKKKRRFSEEQYSLLESIFRERSTLTAAEKKEVAARLDLQPEQVENWFQKKRATSKLKNLEGVWQQLKDCSEILQRCSRRLTDENSRLEEEFRELKARERFCPLCRSAATGDDVQVSPKSKRHGRPAEEALLDLNRPYDLEKMENGEDKL